jgi:FHS family L-fucose permease-like MFS transporter
MRFIRPVAMTRVYAEVNVSLLCFAIVSPGLLGSCAIVATSYFMSVMYPTIFALGVKGLGPDTKLGGSLLVMSIVGGALFPPILGWITKWSGSIAAGYTLPAFGYIAVAS